MEWESVTDLVREAARDDERRLLVLAGDDGHFEAVAEALAVAENAVPDGISMSDTTVVGPSSGLPCEHLEATQAVDLLGTSRSAVVLDCRSNCRPTTLGQVVGTVEGGGLLVLLTPPLEDWPDRKDGFDETLAVLPDTVEDVTGYFRDRFVETLRSHPGIAILDLDADSVERDGRTRRAPRRHSDPVEPPSGSTFVPPPLVEACLTQDQADAVAELVTRGDSPRAAVIEADRGRGKSSVAGIVAAWFSARGEEVVVTGPARRSANAFFDRIREILPELDAIRASNGSPTYRIVTESGGSVTFVPVPEIETALDSADALFVEEAAALPVGTLEATLDVDRLVYITTVHGYEGSGRGFAVRFRDSLEAARHDLTEITLTEPIRYAGGDPVEIWASRALLLGAGPVPASVIEDAIPETVTYRALDSDTLIQHEQLLREVFGLLLTAHYRTEPDDLARLLDGSNLAVRVLLHDGHVVAVALIGREGGLPDATRNAVYEGQRIRGNMLPDVLMSQLRDESAGGPIGIRFVRIATHHAVRSRGLGSHLLGSMESEFAPLVDWFGTGYGATPSLISFWARNEYTAVHLSTTRNERSGEHSVLMLKPTSDAGRELTRHHERWLGLRIGGLLADALDHLDPSIVLATLETIDIPPPLVISTHQWRVIAGAAFGPGLYSVDPEPFRRLAVHGLIDGRVALSDRQKRLLVRGLLQKQSWEHVAAQLGFDSPTAALRAFGRALQPLVETYGIEEAQAVRRRFQNGSGI